MVAGSNAIYAPHQYQRAYATRRLEVSLRWVYHVKNRYERAGERGAHELGGYRRSRIEDLEPCIRAWLDERVASELSARFAQYGVIIKTTALWHQLNNPVSA